MSNDNEIDINAHVERVIDSALSELEGIDTASDQFAHITDQIVKLHNLLPEKSSWLKPDMLLPIAANLLGIAVILHHEGNGHILTTKALSFVLKPRW